MKDRIDKPVAVEIEDVANSSMKIRIFEYGFLKARVSEVDKRNRKEFLSYSCSSIDGIYVKEERYNRKRASVRNELLDGLKRSKKT